MGPILLVVFTVVAYVMVYATVPLHARLLYVLVRPKKTVALDGSFLTLMINTTIVNLLFSLDFCLIQAPAASGALFDFYKSIGMAISKIEMIKATTLIFLGSLFHLVLACSRLTAISMPTRHVRIWQYLSYICGALWVLTLLISIPLLLPGTTLYLESVSIFGVPAIEFTFGGSYFLIYSLGLSSVGAIMEIITILCYVGMIIGFRRFIYGSSSGSAEIKRMKMGVLRTTLAAMCTSFGSWVIVFFFAITYGYMMNTGKSLVTDDQFKAYFGFLNAVNNILTPWVLLITFPNIRQSVFFYRSRAISSTNHSKVASTTTPHIVSSRSGHSRSAVSKAGVSVALF